MTGRVNEVRVSSCEESAAEVEAAEFLRILGLTAQAVRAEYERGLDEIRGADWQKVRQDRLIAEMTK